MKFVSLSNLLLLSGGTKFAASFAFRNTGQHHQISMKRSNSILGARKKATETEDDKPEMDPAKRAALQGVLTQIERNYGRGSVVRLGDANHMTIDSTPTGSLTLDAALGGGGYPKGRIVEIYGPESSGKTTLALHAIAECQKKDGTAAFIDAEHALDPVYGT
jgi:recombination protein RecA